MSVLDKLLEPYRAAIEARPSTSGYMEQDPVYESLFPNLAAIRGPQGGGPAPSSLKALARRLEQMGFDVGELEGFQGEGQISSGHAPNSLHYAGNAMDVNYAGGGRWDNETQALNFLARWLNKRYEPDELFYPGHDPVGGHDSHLHFGI